MSLTKRILKHPNTQKLLSAIIAFCIWLVYITSCRQCYIHPDSLRYMQGDDNAVFAFWHGRMMLMLTFCPPKRRMHVLSSPHRDGRLTSQIIGHFNQTTVDGSSSKGGMKAMRKIVALLQSGDNISITPDGPRGPVQVATMGIITLARLTQKPILPVTFSSTRARKLGTWDRFLLALPFGRIVFCVGAPIMIDRRLDDAGQEAARCRFEQVMNELVEQADALVS